MAYKFQLGSAILSGSTKFEELVEAAGGFKPTVTDTAAAVADDSFYFQDSDGEMKRESMADYATAIAGDGLAASSGVLAVGVDDSGIELNSDALRLKDNGVTLAKMAGLARGKFIIGDSSGDPSALALGSAAQFLVSDGDDLIYRSLSGDATMNAAGVLTIGANAVEDSMVNDNVATGLAGDGLTAASGVLAIQVSGAIKLTSDKLGLTGSIAGKGLQFEGGADSLSSLEIKVASSGGITKSAGSSQKSLALDMNGLTAAAVSVANDSFAIVDADDSNKTKKESIADLMTAVAGDGLAASSGVLAVGVDDSTIETDSDALRIKDNGVTLAKMAGITRGSIISGDASGDPQALAVGSAHQFLQSDGTDLAYVSMSGDATLAAGVLSIGATKVTDAMMNDDVATGLAGAGIAAASGVLALDIDELSALGGTGVDQADHFVFSDGGTEKKITFSNMEDAIFGNVSGDIAVAAGGVATIQANAVEDSMVNDNVATGLAGVGLSAASGVLAVDASELSDAAVASGDKFVFQDATDDSTKKESIDDIATFMAGTGLTAVSGVLNARLDVAAKADGDTLAAGVNYFADLTGNATVTLPASPAIGDTVVAKAKGLSSAVIIINKAGSQTIDGEASVTIESPFGAVSMVYVASNDWRLV